MIHLGQISKKKLPAPHQSTACGAHGGKLTKLFPSQVLFEQFGFPYENVDCIFGLNQGEVISVQLSEFVLS